MDKENCLGHVLRQQYDALTVLPHPISFVGRSSAGVFGGLVEVQPLLICRVSEFFPKIGRVNPRGVANKLGIALVTLVLSGGSHMP